MWGASARRFRSSYYDSSRDNYHAEHKYVTKRFQLPTLAVAPGGYVLLRTGEYSADVARLSRPMNHRRVSRQRGRRVSTHTHIIPPAQRGKCRKCRARARREKIPRPRDGRSRSWGMIGRCQDYRLAPKGGWGRQSGTVTGIFVADGDGGNDDGGGGDGGGYESHRVS